MYSLTSLPAIDGTREKAAVVKAAVVVKGPLDLTQFEIGERLQLCKKELSQKIHNLNTHRVVHGSKNGLDWNRLVRYTGISRFHKPWNGSGKSHLDLIGHIFLISVYLNVCFLNDKLTLCWSI